MLDGSPLGRVLGLLLTGVGVVFCAHHLHHGADGPAEGRVSTDYASALSVNERQDVPTMIQDIADTSASEARLSARSTRTHVSPVSSMSFDSAKRLQDVETLVRVVPHSYLADTDRDGSLSAEDIALFAGWFASNGEGADFNGDGMIDPSDFDDYLGAFEAGESVSVRELISQGNTRYFGTKRISRNVRLGSVHAYHDSTVQLSTQGSGNSMRPSP